MSYGYWRNSCAEIKNSDRPFLNYSLLLDILFQYRGVYPVPEIPEARGAWRGVWQTGCVLGMVASLTLTLVSSVLIVCRHSRLCQQFNSRYFRRSRLILAVLIALVIHGLVRSVRLMLLSGLLCAPLRTFDIVSRLCHHLDALARLSLSASYGYLIVFILNVARIKIGPDSPQRARVIFVMLVLCLTVYITVEVYTHERKHLQCLIFLPQGAFIIVNSILPFIFTYRGFAVAQIMSETNALHEEMAACASRKREVSLTGNDQDICICRLHVAKNELNHSGRSVNNKMPNATRRSNSSDVNICNEKLHRCICSPLTICPRLMQQQSSCDNTDSKRRVKVCGTLTRKLETAKQQIQQALTRKTRIYSTAITLIDQESDSSCDAYEFIDTPTTGVVSLEEQLSDEAPAQDQKGLNKENLLERVSQPHRKTSTDNCKASETVARHSESADAPVPALENEGR